MVWLIIHGYELFYVYFSKYIIYADNIKFNRVGSIVYKSMDYYYNFHYITYK